LETPNNNKNINGEEAIKREQWTALGDHPTDPKKGETHHSSNHQVVKHPINGDTAGSMVT